MANLKEQAQWEDGIYQLELTDPVVGGPDGISNLQAKQLGSRTLYLKNLLEEQQEIVEGYSPEMQEGILASLLFASDMAALAMKENERTRLTRFQELTATIQNRGIKTGVNLSKSASATRNISCSDGVVFMRGREYPVANQTNTAAIASNTTSEAGTVIIYMFLTDANVLDVAATTLNGEMPQGAIEIGRATVPGGNTEENDPYLENVNITDSARREPGWPQVQRAPAFVAVPLDRNLPDSGYLVDVQVDSCLGGDRQLGRVEAREKLNNGFKLMTTGNADEIRVRMLVEHPAI